MGRLDRLAAEVAAMDRRIEVLEAEELRAYRLEARPVEPGKTGRFDGARPLDQIQTELDLLRQQWLNLHAELQGELAHRDREIGLYWTEADIPDEDV